MKRSAAILGPTPQFVRWSIAQTCDLRELNKDNLAESTFRQLRTIREVSKGRSESRIIDGVCLHPDTSSESEVFGFFVDEILQVFGDESEINSLCGNCPANALKGPGIWAGCYGWLPGESFQSANESINLVSVVDQIVEKNQHLTIELDSNFPDSKPAWYRLWQSNWPSQIQLTTMADLFQLIERELATRVYETADANLKADVSQFSNALQATLNSHLEIFVELVPPGHSDGLHWTTVSHCPDCKCAQESDQPVCPACRRNGPPEAQRKRKVLGLRPYMKLNGIVGEDRAKEIAEAYRSRKKLFKI